MDWVGWYCCWMAFWWSFGLTFYLAFWAYSGALPPFKKLRELIVNYAVFALPAFGRVWGWW